MIIKIYVEYKVEKESIALYKKDLYIIYSFYDSMDIYNFELYKSLDDSIRFVEEISFKEGSISIETLKTKRKELQDQLANKFKIMDLSIFTFTLVET